MKKLILLAIASCTLLTACPTQQPLVIERTHYRTVPRRVYVEDDRPVKYAPSGGGSTAPEGFRAVEQPGSYSQ